MHFRKQLILSIVHLDIKNIKKLLEIFQNTFLYEHTFSTSLRPRPFTFQTQI